MTATMSIPRWWSDPLTSHGVRVVQRKLLLTVTGQPDVTFYAALTGWQRAKGLLVTGEVDAATAALMGESEDYATPPDWWTKNLAEDGAAVLRFLEQHGLDWAWLARTQGTNGIKPSGLIDVQTAWILEREM